MSKSNSIDFSNYFQQPLSTWMGGCDADSKNAKKSAKFEKNLNGFMDRMLSYFNRCSKRNDGGVLGVNPDFNEESHNGFRYFFFKLFNI